MKRLYAKLMLSALFAGFFILQASAQPFRGQDRGPKQSQEFRGQSPLMNIPNLTDEQKEKIQSLGQEMRRNGINQNTQIKEKRARLQSLTTAENPDMAEINEIIEDIGALRTQLQKERVAFQMQVRDLLDEEQKLFFDSRRLQRNRFGHGRFARN